MSNNINDLFANLNVPDDVKQMINSGSSNDLNNLLSQWKYISWNKLWTKYS